MRFGLFGKGGPDKSEAAAQANRVKALLREIADLPEAAAIAVNEILCADPACPGTTPQRPSHSCASNPRLRANSASRAPW